MFDQITEYESAVMTAENLGDAYRAMGDGGQGTNVQARTIIATALIRFHPSLSKADRVAVANAVIAKWLADYDS